VSIETAQNKANARKAEADGEAEYRERTTVGLKESARAENEEGSALRQQTHPR